MEQIDWNKKARGLLRAELVKRDISYEKLVNRLAEIGVEETLASVKNKISRGTFKASFLIQCLTAIGCKTLQIE